MPENPPQKQSQKTPEPTPCEKPESAASEDERRRRYYYDDAHGYEIYRPDESTEEDADEE